MVTLTRLPGTKCFSKVSGEARVIVRPRGEVPGDDFIPTQDTIREAIVAFPHRLADAAEVCTWLENEAEAQRQAAPDAPTRRVVFLDRLMNVVAVIVGSRRGEIPAVLNDGGQSRANGVDLGDQFGLLLSEAELRFDGTSLSVEPSESPHRLVRWRQAPSSADHLATDAVTLALDGDMLGLVMARGRAGPHENGKVTSDLTTYHDLGLVSSFVELIKTSGPFGDTLKYRATRAALLHAGDGFDTVASFAASFDPHELYDGERSFLRLLPEKGGDALTLSLPATPGQPVRVRPSGGDWERGNAPRFVFTNQIGDGKSLEDQREDLLTLVGEYLVEPLAVSSGGIGAALDVSDLGLVPGFAASEAMQPMVEAGGLRTQAAKPLTVSFVLGPAFDSTEKTVDGPPVIEEEYALALTAGNKPHRDRTSWMKLHRGGEMDLLAEPPSGRTLDAVASAGATVLNHAPLLRQVGTGGTDKHAGFLPVLPPRGVLADDLDLAKAFDRGLLARERRRVSQAPRGAKRGQVPMVAGAASPVTTPLGFEVETNADGSPTRLVFARVKLETGEAVFALRGKAGAPIPSPILDALVRNKLFLVANRMPSAVEVPGLDFESSINIGGYSFDVRLDAPDSMVPIGETSPRFDTFVIVKNVADRSIAELVGDPSSWSGRGLFLTNPRANTKAGADPKQAVGEVQKALDAFIARARAISEGKIPTGGDEPTPADPARYGRLYNAILNDASWQGVLVVGASFDLAGLPVQLKGLLGGIDLERLKAEYIAVPLKPLPSGGVPQSRLQGLVDYRGPPKAKPDVSPEEGQKDDEEGPYGFDVPRLVVEFARGEVLGFEARVRLVATKLFRAVGNIQQKKNGGWESATTIELDGRYEKRREGDTVLESYVFETSGSYRYVSGTDPEGDPAAIIRRATLDRVAYETLSAESKDGKSKVGAAFRINGDIEFGNVKIPGLSDLFNIEKVAFSDLRISCDFLLDLVKGVIDGVKKMSFRVGALGFDFPNASVRKDGGGLWSAFPLKFRKFWMFDGPVNLPSLGYVSFAEFDAALAFRFGFDFDLDLGTLGGLSSFKGLRLGLLFAFVDGGSSAGNVTFGFRFPEGDGSLDIGLQGFLKLKAKNYGILNTAYSNGKKAKAIYSVGTQLEVLGQDFPADPGITFAVLAAPELIKKNGLGSIGWLAARKFASDTGRIGNVIDLELIALGQRVDPMKGVEVRTTKDFVAQLGNLFADDLGSEEADPKKIAEKIIKAIETSIGFAPDRNWSLGFSAWIADRVQIGLAVRDADIYGLRVDLRKSRSSPDPLFAVDVLYRKLSERLGVYSIEIVPPEQLRQIDFGWVVVDLPAIGIEIFTDGGFTIDLGYPHNMDYARAFSVQVLPFIGSGGLYYRQVSGPGANFIPHPRFKKGGVLQPRDETVLSYQVVEAGIAFRVGLGKEIDKGIFRAGLSLTVFATLEGGFGYLKKSDAFAQNGFETGAATTFIAVGGTVGVMGEVYGYVDFGIVKAGVAIRLWVALSLDFKTDHRTRLFMQVGVSVAVEVEIASFKIFGRRISISISFSFDTTVEYSTYLGSDRNAEYYEVGAGVGVASIPRARTAVAEYGPIAAFDWTRSLAPAEWREAAAKLAFALRFSPDVTLANHANQMRPEAVMILTSEVPDKTPTDIDGVPAMLAAWAFRAAYEPGSIRDKTVSLDELDALARAVAEGPPPIPGAPAPTAPPARLAHLPDVSAILSLFADNIAATFEEHLVHDDPPPPPVPAVFWPIPPRTRIRRHGFADDAIFDDVTPSEKRVVDDHYRDTVDLAFREQMAVLNREDGPGTVRTQAAPPPISIADAAFTEYAILLMRAALVRLASLAHESILADKDRPDRVRLGPLLDRLTASPGGTGMPDVPGPARDILRSASRIFMHAPRLPFPELAKGDLSLVPPDAMDPTAHHSLFRLGWLQVPLGAAANTGGAGADTRRIEVEIDPGFGAKATLSVDDVIGANLDTFAALGTTKPALGGAWHPSQLVRTERRRFHAGLSHPRNDGGRLVMLDPLLLSQLAERALADASLKLFLRKLPDSDKELPALPADIEHDKDTLKAKPAIAVRIRLASRRAEGGTSDLDVFEILGMSEANRVRLDRYEDGQNPGEIVGIAFYRLGDTLLNDVGAPPDATVVQVDVSAEPKPDADGAKVQPAPVQATYVARLDEIGAFVDIVRRTGMVNRGGTVLGWDGGKGTFGAGSTVEALMVLTLRADAVGQANAMLIAPADAAGADRLEAVLAGDAGTDAVASVGEPVAQAGTMPAMVVRKPLPPPEGADAGAWKALIDRFSMLAVGISGQDGTVLVEAAKALSVGPTKDATTGALMFSLPIPVAKLFRDASPYRRVGQTLMLRGLWRDVYGNEWPVPAFVKPDARVQYVDRLTPFTDLPGLGIGWWPTATPGILQVKLQIERRWPDSLVPSPPPTQSQPDDKLTAAAQAELAGRLERTRAVYACAAEQIADPLADATLTASWSEATVAPDLGTALQTFIKLAADALGKLVELDLTRSATAIRDDIKNAIAGLSRSVSATAPIPTIGESNADFFELALTLKVARRETNDAGDQIFFSTDATSDMKSFSMPVRLRLRELDSIPPDDPFGGTLVELQQAVWSGFAPHHLVGTGLSAQPGIGDRAAWLIRREVLPPPDHLKRGARHDFALPPVSTHLHTVEFTEKTGLLPTFGGMPRSATFRAVDADVEAARALAAYEQILKPEIVDRLMRSSVGRAALQEIVTAKAGFSEDVTEEESEKLGIAQLLATRAAPVFVGSAPAPQSLALTHRVLTDLVRGVLTRADTIDTIVVLGDPDPTTRPVAGKKLEAGPQAYGRFEPEGAAIASVRPFVMSVGTQRVRRDLAMAVDVPPDFAEAFIQVVGRYRVTHVQRLDRPDNVEAGRPGRYRPTAWLALVPPPVEKKQPGLSHAPIPAWLPEYEIELKDVPVLRRRYPVVPALLRETATETSWPPAMPIDASLRDWSSSRTWKAEAIGPDRMDLGLRYNPSPARNDVVSSAASATEFAWATAFLRFAETVGPALETARKTGPSAADVELAAFLRDACQSLWVTLRTPLATPASSDPDIFDRLRLEEEPSTGGSRRIKLRRNADPRVAGTRLTLDVMKSDTAVAGSYAVADGDWANAPSTPGSLQIRQLGAEGADILLLRAVQTELTLSRNAMIGPKTVDEPFVYRVPTVVSGAPVLPVIDVAEAPLATAPAPFETHLAQLLDAFIGPDGGPAAEALQELALDLVLTFEPELAPGLDVTADGLHVAGLSRLDLSTKRAAWIQPFVDAVAAWRGTRAPTQGLFAFDVRLYERGEGRSERLIMRVRRITLGITLIT
ncbi:hypothetical protein [Methylobacterium flocculans]|uniref:hypothetical protein n=1 Tax=Methylobacterium flocculans TaxID=2984843 RepID=UPI0021F34C84|nr:hypothetical protein [Methylobacterium sp. FF17]